MTTDPIEIIADTPQYDYVQAPHWVLLAPVKDGSKILYLLLRAHVNTKRARAGDTKVWPSQATLAQMMNLSRADKILPYLNELIDCGLVAREKTKVGKMRDRNTYRIRMTPPSNWQHHLSIEDVHHSTRPEKIDKTPGRAVVPKTGLRSPQNGYPVVPISGPELDEPQLHEDKNSSPLAVGEVPTVTRERAREADHDFWDCPDAACVAHGAAEPQTRPKNDLQQMGWDALALMPSEWTKCPAWVRPSLAIALGGAVAKFGAPKVVEAARTYDFQDIKNHISAANHLANLIIIDNKAAPEPSALSQPAKSGVLLEGLPDDECVSCGASETVNRVRESLPIPCTICDTCWNLEVPA